jgi:hypothetical protein
MIVRGAEGRECTAARCVGAADSQDLVDTGTDAESRRSDGLDLPDTPDDTVPCARTLVLVLLDLLDLLDLP